MQEPLRLKSLKIKNLRVFKDVEIKFPASGLCLIRGRDTVTGESSGTGKSTIFLAISYVFGYLPTEYSAKGLQTWGSDEMSVTASLSDGTVICRGTKKSYLQWPDGHRVEGAKAVSDEIPKVFGMDSEVLAALTYREQDSSGFFLTMEPGDKFEFLTKVLGLQKIVAAVEGAQKNVSELENQYQRIGENLDRLKLEYSNIAQRAPKAPETSENAEMGLDSVRGDIAALDANTAALRASRAEALSFLTEQKKTVVDCLNSDRKKALQFLELLQEKSNDWHAQHDLQVEDCLETLKKVRQEFSALQSQKARLPGLKKQVEALAAGNCSTCLRAWDKSGEARAEIESEISSVTNSLLRYDTVEMQIFGLEERRRAILSDTDPHAAKMASLSNIVNSLDVRLAALKGEIAAVGVPEIDEKLLSNEKLRNELRVRLSVMEEKARNDARQMSEYLSLKTRHDKELADARKRLDDVSADLDKVTSKLCREKDFVSLLGRDGFMGRFLGEILSEVESDANERLRRLSNTRSVGIQFLMETDAGKQRIQAMVNIRGNVSKFKTGPSGGMKTSIHQCVDLALVAAIRRRATRPLPGWLCLDEVFNGQGRVTKESTLEILQEQAQDHLVLVVDHGTEFQEAFGHSILVEFNDGFSEVKNG